MPRSVRLICNPSESTIAPYLVTAWTGRDASFSQDALSLASDAASFVTAQTPVVAGAAGYWVFGAVRKSGELGQRRSAVWRYLHPGADDGVGGVGLSPKND
jgi:hypothetical protein